MDTGARLLTKEEIGKAAGIKLSAAAYEIVISIVQAQDSKTLRITMAWLDDLCPHGTQAGDTSQASRRECDRCWAELMAELEAK